MTPEHDATAGRGRPALVLACIGLSIALAGSATWAWLETARSTAQQVTVDASPLECTGTTVHDYDLETMEFDTGSGASVPAVSLTPGLRCSGTLTLTNRSGRKVSLATLRLPLAGPDTGAAVRATAVTDADGPVRTARADEHHIDHLTLLDRPLAAGGQTKISVEYSFWEQGCTAVGAFWTDAAEVEVSAWGRPHLVVSSQKRVWLGTPESDACST